ncbi:MAG: hypothetical protein KA369_17055 [Spirochaetes bacterium]|nr:hypothetical protein [Spirochaetota bacterium]
MSQDGITSEELNSLVTITRKEITDNIQHIAGRDKPVWRKKSDGTMVPIPVEKLEQYVGENQDEITFYIHRDWRDKPVNKNPLDNLHIENVPSFIKHIEQYGDIKDQTGRFRKMTIVDREELLDLGLEQMKNIRENNEKLDLSVLVKMVEIVAYTFYTHNANIEDITESPNLKNNIQGIMGKTRWILTMLIDQFKTGLVKYTDFNMIEDISTHSLTFDHIIRVMLKFIAFCIFFNHYIDQGLVTKKIRAVFREKYLRYYRKRLPIENIAMETVFKNGIRRIDETEELVDYAMGALLFDMGKLLDLSYHDSIDAGYDEKIVRKHVLNGYNMIMNAKSYPFVVPAMAAFHHELYSDKGGYNFTAPIIAKLFKTRIDETKVKYYISYDEKDLINGIALAYMPVKILEVVDIFDALKNKKKKSAYQSLLIMKKEFITKSLKIDPLIYAIFLEFNSKCDLITPQEFEEIDAIIY